MATRKPRNESDSNELRTKKVTLSAVGKDDPWWMPDNIEVRTRQISKDLIKSAFERGYFDLKAMQEAGKLSLKKRRKFFDEIIFDLITHPEVRIELAKMALIKPLELAKLAIASQPKNIKIEGEITHKHAIVVPGTVSAEEWDKAHSVRKELEDGDWGVDLADTPFVDVEPEESEHVVD